MLFLIVHNAKQMPYTGSYSTWYGSLYAQTVCVSLFQNDWQSTSTLNRAQIVPSIKTA